MYFSVLTPKQVNCVLNFSTNSYDKMIIIVRSIMKKYRDFLGTPYFKLHMLYAAPAYSPV